MILKFLYFTKQYFQSQVPATAATHNITYRIRIKQKQEFKNVAYLSIPYERPISLKILYCVQSNGENVNLNKNSFLFKRSSIWERVQRHFPVV